MLISDFSIDTREHDEVDVVESRIRHWTVAEATTKTTTTMTTKTTTTAAMQRFKRGDEVTVEEKGQYEARMQAENSKDDDDESGTATDLYARRGGRVHVPKPQRRFGVVADISVDEQGERIYKIKYGERVLVSRDDIILAEDDDDWSRAVKTLMTGKSTAPASSFEQNVSSGSVQGFDALLRDARWPRR